jgi:hypothetical protein
MKHIKHIILLTSWALLAGAFPAAPAHAQGQSQGKYKNFRVALYALRGNVTRWTNSQTLAADYDEMTRQIKFDKVYLEFAGGHQMVNEATLDPIKKFFTDRGLLVSAAIVPNGLSLTNQADRAYLKGAVEAAARHFDEVIFDDWFFMSSKTAGDIAAKGNRSWTQYRLDAWDEAAENLCIKPGKAINPQFRLIIKYPNWYEHYQGLGYDVDVEPKIFDAVYTGVETRDAIASEQHLQSYESYSLVRYFENAKPGGNDGAWIDQGDTRYIDRYAEQFWDAAFAKARELTLWHWAGALQPINVGTRPWQETETSLNLSKVVLSTLPASSRGVGAMTGRVAGYALEQLDTFLDKLGNPIGIAAYRPPHAIGEEFLYDYLGMIGIPIDLHPTFPTNGNVCLLDEGAKYDPDLVQKIKAQLSAGKNVIITSGLLRALVGKGIEDISEFEVTDQRVSVNGFQGRGGRVLAGATVNAPILFRIIHFLTNQSWGQVNGYDTNSPWNAYPIVISDVYDRGTLYVLVVPDNFADLYRLPAPVLNSIRSLLMGSFPVRLEDAPAQVSLFAYDNNSFVAQSFLDAPVTVTVSVAGTTSTITDLVSGQTLSRAPAPARGAARRGFGGGGGGRRGGAGAPESSYAVTIPPHSYRAFTAQN